MTRTLILLALSTGLLIRSGQVARAEVRLPKVLSSHMVLQRDVPLQFWGWAEPGEKVSVRMGSERVAAKADEEGNWLVTLKARKAEIRGQQITISGSNEIVLEDVLIGDVWIGSGQSNMEWQLKNTMSGAKAIAAAKHPAIRLFHVPKVQKPQPQTDLNANWKACAPSTATDFSAVLYFFGERLHPETKVPMGLINSSWGGSPIEPWTIADGQSGGMYNGMIAPLTKFPMRGTIWYQGETNVIQNNGLAYLDKMKALIGGWRNAFANPEMPFYFVQIAPWSGGRYAAGQLPALWEAQCAALKIPNTGMAVTTDLVDNIGDIHPRNKKDVGNRLALWALAKNYGQKKLVYSGPLYKSMSVMGDRVRLEFAHATDGLKSRDGEPLSEFEIAGEDGAFVAAEARIRDGAVWVRADGVTVPKQVRFGWHKQANPNLVNSVGLPASPFQTENWQGGTGERAQTRAPLRGFTNTAGKTIRARVVRVSGGKASIVREDGKSFTVPVASLSEADREYLEAWASGQ